MKLYYEFCLCGCKDYEFEIEDENVADYLTTLTSFSKEEIMQEINLFTNLFYQKIHTNFQQAAKNKFEKNIEIEEKSILSFLKDKEVSQRNRQNFLKREALKKKGIVE